MTSRKHSESEDHSFLRFVIVSTLTVVGIALCILSPWILYIYLMNLGLQNELLSYVAFVAFWSIFIIVVILAAVIDWTRKRKKAE